MGRFLCNTLQEALDSAAQTVGGRKRDFDTIVVGGGTFGCVVAEHLFIADVMRSRRILVLEAGPFVLPEPVQNMPFMGGTPDLRAPWVNPLSVDGPDVGRVVSRTAGCGADKLASGARAELRARCFGEASRQIGVKDIYGPLHTALRKQLDDGLNAPVNGTGFTFADLLDHPAVRYPDPGEPPLDATILRDWLGLPASDTTPLAKLKELFKLEAPLAVQSTTLPSFFPTNKFSAVPKAMRSARPSAMALLRAAYQIHCWL